ncbi:MAG: serine hydrolase domain-containing protein [Chloroflexota bacterium]
MRRFWIILFAVLVLSAGVVGPRVVKVSAAGHSNTVAAKKKCKKGLHRVHGKCKKKQPVVASTPVATPALSFTEQVDAYLARQHFSGSILLASKGEILMSKGYGMADREHSVANTPQTQFQISHSTKQFTAMAVLLLQERGKLTVNTPICTYISDCPEEWKPITIHELLSQTSGIPDVGAVHSADAAPNPEAFISLFKHVPFDFQPGTQFGFSDPGFVILGAIVAKLSGEPYEMFMQKNIFDPLQMRSTGFMLPNTVLSHGAVGYLAGTPSTSAPAPAFPNAGYGMYSTVEDLSRWDEALAGGALSEKSWTAMFTQYEDISGLGTWPDSFSSVGIGYGWFVTKDANRRLAFYDDSSGDTGSFGFESYNGRYLDDKVTVTMLGNQSTDANQKDIGSALAVMVFAHH